MDPFSIISLASSINTFVDFTLKLVSNAREVYQSAAGATDRNLRLDAVATRLRHLNRGLVARGRELDRIKQDEEAVEHAQALRAIIQSCDAVTAELLDALNKLQPKTKSKWRSVYAALKTVLKQAKLDELDKQLVSYRNEMVLHIIIIICSDQPAVHRKIDTIAQTATETKSIQLDILNTLKAQSIKSKPQSSDEQFVIDQLDKLSLEKETKETERALLDTLQSSQLGERERQVAEAHSTTFQWIFEAEDTESKADSFSDWLLQGSGIYWITGKPGAGKSTLMKFLCQHRRTKQLLRKWAGEKNLITASFYFWISGTPMQKSSSGLLQSLLHEILVQDPSIIPKLFPKRWRMHQLYGAFHGEPWTEGELLDAIRILKTEAARSSKICFFIDGLDEFAGQHKELTLFLQELSSLPNIKICASSRPWLVFQDALGNTPMLRVQDFTRKDIECFARDTLESSARWKEMQRQSPQKASGLIHDIVEKSSGVFLWVFLVARSLLEGLQNADRLAELQARLDACPTKLEDLFKRILGELDPLYLQQAQKFFKIAMESSEPLLLMTYSYLGDEDLDPNFDINAPIAPMSSEAVFSRLEEAERRLRSRCKDLLEIYVEEGAERTTASYTVLSRRSNNRQALESLDQRFYMRVGFLHRTVRDFLEMPDAKSVFSSTEADEFNPPLWLLRTTTAQVKALPPKSYFRFRNSFFDRLIVPAVMCFSKLEHFNTPYLESLDEFDHTLGKFCKEAECTTSGVQLNHWTEALAGNFTNILELAAAASLKSYMEREIQKQGPENLRHQQPFLLSYALDGIDLYNKSGTKRGNEISQNGVTSTLVEYGFSKNRRRQPASLYTSTQDIMRARRLALTSQSVVNAKPPSEGRVPSPSYKHQLDKKPDTTREKRRRLEIR